MPAFEDVCMFTRRRPSIRRTSLAVVAIALLPIAAAAQPSRGYVGGTLDLVTQTQPDGPPLGGTVVGGRAVIGVQLSPQISIEFEPSFANGFSWQYSYRPTPYLTADVVASRRNTSFAGQVRFRFGVAEPVVGVSYIHGALSRHATILNSTYFDESGSDPALALVGGLDAAVPLARRLFLVPTIRVLLSSTVGAASDALERDTETGAVVIRYGLGIRVPF
jgi:hypothetical protein